MPYYISRPMWSLGRASVNYRLVASIWLSLFFYITIVFQSYVTTTLVDGYNQFQHLNFKCFQAKVCISSSKPWCTCLSVLKAYSTISITDLCSLLGQTEQEVKQGMLCVHTCVSVICWHTCVMCVVFVLSVWICKCTYICIPYACKHVQLICLHV